jgi:hypothetical protein
MSTVPVLVLPDIAANVRSYNSSKAFQDVGYLEVKLLDISREKRYRQEVLILEGTFYMT